MTSPQPPEPSATGAEPGARRLATDVRPGRSAVPEGPGAYVARDPGRIHVPGHKGGPAADPELREAIGERALAMDIPALTWGIDTGPAPTPFEEAQALAAEAWGAARSWFLINGASQGNHVALLALAHAGDRVVVQRNAHSSTVDGCILAGPDAHVRVSRGRPRAGHRALPGARGARCGAGGDPGGRRCHRGLPDLLRRRGRRGSPRGGRPLARGAVGGGRGLGRASGLSRGRCRPTRSPVARTWWCRAPTRSSARSRSRPWCTWVTRPRGGWTPASWIARSRSWSPRAPTRCCSARSTPPAGSRPRAGTSCWGRRSPLWPKSAQPSARSTAWTCSTNGWWARPACTATTRCGWPSTCAAPASAATSSRACCASATTWSSSSPGRT